MIIEDVSIVIALIALFDAIACLVKLHQIERRIDNLVYHNQLREKRR